MKLNKSVKYIYLFTILSLFLCNNHAIAQEHDKFVVVLDAGHGGHDPGKHAKSGLKEKDIALKMVKLIGKELDKNTNIKVIYTRTTDVFLELRRRAEIANKADADLFVSVHCNAHHTQAYGTETYVLGVKNTDRNFNVAKAENEVVLLEDNYELHYEGFNPNAPESMIGLTLQQEDFVDQSIILAGLIEDKFKYNLKRKSRGVKQTSLWVLHNTYMPSVLIETGFITNTSEGKYLNSSDGQIKISHQIAKAILDYKNTLDQNIGSLTFSEFPDPEASTADDIYEGVTFKVQIAASKNKVETKSYNFKGLKDISRLQIGNLYKYYSGKTSSYSKVNEYLQKAKAKGYTSSYIVAFKNEKQVEISKVLK